MINWAARAACADPGIADFWMSREPATRATARHICRVHCPVLAECNAEAVARFHGPPELRYRGVVAGGISFNDSGNVAQLTGVRPDCWICSGDPPRRPRPRSEIPAGHGTDTSIRNHRAAAEPLCDACRTSETYRLSLEARRGRARRKVKSP